MYFRLLLRMKRLAQRPPSMAMVKMVFAIILAAALLYAYEYFYGWPEFLTLDAAGRKRGLPRF
jgi:hypothetical protein